MHAGLWPRSGFWAAYDTTGVVTPCAAPKPEMRCTGWSVALGETRCGTGYLQGSYLCSACAPGNFLEVRCMTSGVYWAPPGPRTSILSDCGDLRPLPRVPRHSQFRHSPCPPRRTMARAMRAPSSNPCGTATAPSSTSSSSSSSSSLPCGRACSCSCACVEGLSWVALRECSTCSCGASYLRR